MPPKPMDKRTLFDTRQAVWDAIRKLGDFSLKEVREETVLHLESVRDYLTGLEKGGYIERTTINRRHFEEVRWLLVRDIGFEAPRVRKDGTPVTSGQGNENMWQAMRILRTFTALELAVAARTPTCHVKESSASDYARHLFYAGYLSRTENGVYRMLPTAYTGPKAPMIQRTKVVWDPNRNEVRWRSDEEDSHDQR
jgi:hypothetical protein